jgi:hypothetical protein
VSLQTQSDALSCTHQTTDAHAHAACPLPGSDHGHPEAQCCSEELLFVAKVAIIHRNLEEVFFLFSLVFPFFWQFFVTAKVMLIHRKI